MVRVQAGENAVRAVRSLARACHAKARRPERLPAGLRAFSRSETLQRKNARLESRDDVGRQRMCAYTASLTTSGLSMPVPLAAAARCSTS